jgi:hypothetical protein
MPTAPLILKPQAERIEECLTVLRKITQELNIPPTNPSIQLLRLRMGRYWRDGAYDEDRIPLDGYDRIIVYRLPKWSGQLVEVMLKHAPLRRSQRLPSNLLEELEAQSNNEPQSRP